MSDNDCKQVVKDEQLGYFRPGFFPFTSQSVVPAMVCLSELPFTAEPKIEFILVKTNCYLKEWQDALLVSEQDYDQALTKCRGTKNTVQKIERLFTQFKAKGYLPLTKVKTDIQINHLQ